MEVAKTIELQMGDSVVELQMSPTLVEKIKKTFGLLLDQEITDRHVKYYLTNGMRNALEASNEKNSTS